MCLVYLFVSVLMADVFNVLMIWSCLSVVDIFYFKGSGPEWISWLYSLLEIYCSGPEWISRLYSLLEIYCSGPEWISRLYSLLEIYCSGPEWISRLYSLLEIYCSGPEWISRLYSLLEIYCSGPEWISRLYSLLEIYCSGPEWISRLYSLLEIYCSGPEWISRLYSLLEIYHSGPEPSIYLMHCFGEKEACRVFVCFLQSFFYVLFLPVNASHCCTDWYSFGTTHDQIQCLSSCQHLILTCFKIWICWKNSKISCRGVLCCFVLCVSLWDCCRDWLNVGNMCHSPDVMFVMLGLPYFDLFEIWIWWERENM